MRVEIVDCPACGLPAEVVEHCDIDSTAGPIPHARVWCSADSAHKFFAPVDNLGLEY